MSTMTQYKEITKSELEEFLSDLFGGSVLILRNEFESNECFDIVLRAKVPEDRAISEKCAEWVDRFSRFTNSDWTLHSSFPKLRRLLFRKKFVCKLSGFNRTNNSSYSIKLYSCQALMDFKLKFINKNTVKTDKLLKDGFNLIFHVKYHHTHQVQRSELNENDQMNWQSVEQYKQYFDNGLVPTAAHSLHKLILTEQYGQEANSLLKNADLNPSIEKVLYLYQTWSGLKNEISPNWEEEILIKKRKLLEESGYTFISYDDPKMVILLSPTMKRIFLTNASNEMIYISTNSFQNGEIKLIIIYVVSKIGALPVASAVLQSKAEHQTAQLYIVLFTNMKQALEDNFLSKRFHPNVVMHDQNYSVAEGIRNVLPMSSVFESSDTQCEAFWRWLNMMSAHIDKEHIESLMTSYYNIMNAATVQAAELEYINISRNRFLDSLPELACQLKKLADNRSEWLITFKNDVLTGGLTAHRITELSIRIFRDTILKDCETLSFNGLIDFVSQVLETYTQRRLTIYAESKDKVSDMCLRFYYPTELKLNIYNKQSSKCEIIDERHQIYTIQLDSVMCDCIDGAKGQFCSHLTYLELQHNVFINTPKCKYGDEQSYYTRLALGDTNCTKDGQKNLDGDVKLKQSYVESVNSDIENSEDDISSKMDSQSDNDNTPISTLKVETKSHDKLKGQHIKRNVKKFKKVMKTKKKYIPVKKNIVYNNALIAIKRDFNRITHMYKQEETESNFEALKQLITEMKAIQSANDATEFIMTLNDFNADEVLVNGDNGREQPYLSKCISRKRKNVSPLFVNPDESD